MYFTDNAIGEQKYHVYYVIIGMHRTFIQFLFSYLSIFHSFSNTMLQMHEIYAPHFQKYVYLRGVRIHRTNTNVKTISNYIIIDSTYAYVTYTIHNAF